MRGASRRRLAAVSLRSCRAYFSSDGGGFTRNFMREFKSSLKSEYEKNKALHSEIGLLSSKTSDLSKNSVVLKAKEVAKSTSKTTAQVIDSVAHAADRAMDSKIVKGTGQVMSDVGKFAADVTRKVAEPVANTKAAKVIESGLKSIKNDIIDIREPQEYGSLSEESKRLAEWENLVQQKAKRNSANAVSDIKPSECRDVALTPVSPIERYMEALKSSGHLGNILHNLSRKVLSVSANISEKTSSFFNMFNIKETEEAKVILMFREVDPEFKLSEFAILSAKYIIPIIADLYVNMRLMLLKEWCNEKAFVKIKLTMNMQPNYHESKLLDIRGVSVYSISLIENLPVITVTFQTYESRTTLKEIRNKNKPVTEVNSAVYVVQFTKTRFLNPTAKFNPKTDDWIMIDFSRANR